MDDQRKRAERWAAEQDKKAHDSLLAEVERLRALRPHLIAEPECTCYEYIGGHQMGCPMYGMSPEAIKRWQDDYSTQCHEIEETIQWKNLVESCNSKEQRIASLEVDNARLADGVAKERQRCIDIVNAARAGEIDSDLRCIRSWIEDGDDAPKGGPRSERLL